MKNCSIKLNIKTILASQLNISTIYCLGDNMTGIVIGVIIGALVIIVIIVAVVCMKKRKKEDQRTGK